MDSFPDQVIPIVYHSMLSSTIDDLGKGLSGKYYKTFDVGVTTNLNINRKHMDLPILPGSTKDNAENWYKLAEFDKEAIVSVDIKHTWDKNSRMINGNVVVNFEEQPENKKISVALFIVEDSVVGGERYDQFTNYFYHGNYPEIEKWGVHKEADSVHFAAGYWIEKYPHHWSFRESILNNDFWGNTSALPANIKKGKDYLIPFKHELPKDYHKLNVVDKNIEIVAFIAYKDKEVLNAESKNLISDAVNKMKIHKNNNFKLKLKKDGNYLFVNSSLHEDGLLTLYSVNGKKLYEERIFKENKSHAINLKNISNQVIFLKYKSEKLTFNSIEILK